MPLRLIQKQVPHREMENVNIDRKIHLLKELGTKASSQRP
jgi:hypothetical protein